MLYKMNKNICFKRNGKYNTLYKYCVKKSSIPKDFHIDDSYIIGEGSYGVVLPGTIDKIPIAVKLTPLDVPIPTVDCGLKTDGGDCIKYSKKEFEDEVKISKEFGDFGITPKVYFSDIVNLSEFHHPQLQDDTTLDKPEKIGVIILERFGKSLHEWMRTDIDTFLKYEQMIQNEVWKLEQELYKLGYFNMDSHFGNILFDQDSKSIKLIDLMLKKNVLSEKEIKQKFEEGWEFERSRMMRKLGYMPQIEVLSEEEEENDD
jgi:hypothetical protein